MQSLPKSIIISGTGRNVGKTTLSCRLIGKYKEERPLGIKISPHKHPIGKGDIVICKNANYIILQETQLNTGKDSSRMLAAGAEKVFFVMAEDKYLIDAMNVLGSIIDFSSRIIIESAALRRYFKPSKFIIVSTNEFPSSKPKNKDLEDIADLRLRFDGKVFLFANAAPCQGIKP